MSVVLACTGNAAHWETVLAALRRGCAGVATELVVVSAGERVPLDAAGAEFPAAQLLRRPPNTLVPELWGAGVPLARGEFIGFTTDRLLVGPGWAESLLRVLGSDVAGAGGPIAPPVRGGAATTAAWLVRFSSFGPEAWPADASAPSIPGDNAVYRRDALLRHPDLLQDGFWEVEFHHRFALEGYSLRMVPAARVTLLDAGSLRHILRQRYRHAREFGQCRVRRHSESLLKLLLAAPLVPFMLMGRITVRAGRERMRLLRLLRALPLVMLLTCCWAAGEAVGGMRARAHESPRR